MKTFMRKMIAGAITGLAICAGAGSAFAHSEMQPGVGNGLALGVPLPEGIYDITFLNYGSRPTNPATDAGVAIPAWLVWATPWEIAGGRLAFGATQPFYHLSNAGIGLNKNIVANTLLETSVKWNLGNGFNFGIYEALWVPGAAPYSYAFASFMQVVALSYVKNDWSLTATGIYGTGRNGSEPGHYAPSWANLELTALRIFGKWEFGPIAFASSDLNSPNKFSPTQSQIAVGGLVGYNFGPILTQFKLTRDVAERNYGGYETRAWLSFVIPLWNPQPAPVVAAKY